MRVGGLVEQGRGKVREGIADAKDTMERRDERDKPDKDIDRKP